MQTTNQEEVGRGLLESVPAIRIQLGKAIGRHGRASRVDNFLLASLVTLQRLPKPFTYHQAIVRLRSRFPWDHPSTVSIWRKLCNLEWVEQLGSKSAGKPLWQTREIDCTTYLQEAERLLLKGDAGAR